MSQANIGLIGLAVMGQNLVLNMNDSGFVGAVFNRTTSKGDDFLEGAAAGTQVTSADERQRGSHCAAVRTTPGRNADARPTTPPRGHRRVGRWL